jgi:hypothetical protein
LKNGGNRRESSFDEDDDDIAYQIDFLVEKDSKPLSPPPHGIGNVRRGGSLTPTHIRFHRVAVLSVATESTPL